MQHGGVKPQLVDGAQTFSRDCEANPHLLLHPEEFLGEEVNVEFALGATLRVRNVVTRHGFLACDLTHL